MWWAFCCYGGLCGKEPIEPSLRVTLGEKGSASINKASKERKESIQCVPGQVIHKECHRKYCVPGKHSINPPLGSRSSGQQKGSLISAFIVVNQQHQERKEKLLNH